MLNRQLELDLDDHQSFNADNDNCQTENEAKFRDYHAENPHVYELIKKFTFEMIKAGRTRYSMMGVFHRIRWYTDIETRGEPFKIGQNHFPYSARMFMRDHPEHDGFFKTRALGKKGARQ